MARFARSDTRTALSWGLTPGLIGVSAVVGLVSFLVNEFMHRLLVQDLGRHWERPLAEGVSAVVVAGLTAGLVNLANQRQQAALLRVQVTCEMNHRSVQVMSESVDRIERRLREVLRRNKPIPEKKIDRLRYRPIRTPRQSTYGSQEKTHE